MKDSNQFIKSIYNRYFFTSCFAILCSGLGQIVNNLVVGNVLGSKVLSVMALVVPIYYVFATLGNLLGIGGTAVCAALVGEGKHEECRKAFSVTYIIMVVASVILTAILLVLLPQIVRWIGADELMYDQAYQYAIVMVIGGIFTAGVYLSFNFLRLDGRNQASIYVFVFMAVINIVLDVVLTKVIPLGILGVSIATSAGAAAATLFGAILLFTKSDTLRLCKVKEKEFWKYSCEIARVGSPGAAENVCILLKSLLLNKIILAQFGAMAVPMLSVLSVVNSVNSFALSIIAGAAGTLVPFIGIFSAEKDIKSIIKVLRTSALQGSLFTLLFTVACLLLASVIGSWFGLRSIEEQVLVVPAIRIFCISLLLSMWNHILIFLHLANKKTFLSNVLVISRNFVMIIVFAFVLPDALGTNGIWWAFVCCEAATLLVGVLLQVVEKVGHKNMSVITLMDESILKQGKDISFIAYATTDSIMNCVEQISTFCEDNELTPKRAMLISLSLEEMLQSICVHALGENAAESMNVRIFIYNDRIILRIRNGGKLFNPISYYEQTQQKQNGSDVEDMLQLDDTLGIKMIVDACEKVYYSTTFGVNNLTIVV